MAGKKAEQKAEQPKQLGFHLLAGLSISERSTIPPGKQNGIATVAFDAPPVASEAPPAPRDVATGSKTEVYRPAPTQRKKAKKPAEVSAAYTQATFDDFFTQLLAADEENIPRSITISESWHNPGDLSLLDFDSLTPAAVPTDEDHAIPAGKPVKIGRAHV